MFQDLEIDMFKELNNINFNLNENLFKKDPQSSELGRKILSNSIELIDQLGFEAFTFKKLGEAIGSNESSVYRYFENKHKLLLYILSWYWNWLEFKLMFATNNITDYERVLEISLDLVTGEIQRDPLFEFIDEEKLYCIVSDESVKAYMTKEVTSENKEGLFIDYKRLVMRISDTILKINPNYKDPQALISTIIEGSHLQRFYAKNLPALTGSWNKHHTISDFYKELVFKAILT